MLNDTIISLETHCQESLLIRECPNKLNEVGKINKVFLIWVPGHSGIRGNEEANTLVREGARMYLIGPEPFCGISKCTYKKEFLKKEKAEREKLWRNLPGMDHSTEFLRNFETKDIWILVKINCTSSLAFLHDIVASGSTC